MTILGREVINALLIGPVSDGRLVHDSPIRGDVWANFANSPGKAIDVLIEAFRETATGLVASRLARRLYEEPSRPGFEHDRDLRDFGVSFLEGFVAARLRLKDLVYAVLPFTVWTRDLRLQPDLDDISGQLSRFVFFQLTAMRSPGDIDPAASNVEPIIAKLAATFRILAALLWAEDTRAAERIETPQQFFERADMLAIANNAGRLAHQVLRLRPVFEARSESRTAQEDDADIFAVSRNRPVELAIERSVPAIKADAVSTLFAISCERIGWAIFDTGIDETHPAFKDRKREGRSRVVATYDFTRLRQVVLVDYIHNETLLERRAQAFAKLFDDYTAAEVEQDLLTLARNAENGQKISWSIAERYVLVRNPSRPLSPHGTHVAGILGGYWEKEENHGATPASRRGVCPDIKLYDFRVVTGSEDDTEFALVGALQYLQHLNTRNNYPVIHGANISLSIRHDVRNYACGRTPVCDEATRTSRSGVVVVVAAGNRGYQSYNLSSGGAFETYAPSSITDPGNAEAVITVGATHRSAPHSYGVSFFSSRGPTGDGRSKPDLVAPGEKIWSAVPGETEDALSGTSMAAPHVSGAAAMLMARNAEFIGDSAEIKRIILKNCTDLGRERTFQGAGMLDILRAMQDV